MTAAIPMPVRQGTPAWLDARRDSIGSSDIPVITGNSQFRSSPFDLWAVKTRLAEPAPVDPMTQEMFDLGHALEPVIAERYTDQTGRPLRRRNQMLQHRELEWVTASLDRVSAVKGERLIVELKWAPWRRWVEGPEPVPAYVQDQVQWQLMVTGWERADVAVLNGSHVERHTIEADPEYQRNLLVIAEHFHGLVLSGTRPPIDGSEATRRALLRLYPQDDGTPMEPTAELHALMLEWREREKVAKAAKAELDRVKNTLRAVLEEHSEAESERWKVTFRRSKDSRKFDTKALVEVYARTVDNLVRRLRVHDPDLHLEGTDVTTDEGLERVHEALASIYTTTKEGSRSLRATWPGGDEETAWT